MPEQNNPVVCKKELRHKQEENMQELRSLPEDNTGLRCCKLEGCILLIVGKPEPLGKREESRTELRNSERTGASKELQCKQERGDCMKGDCKKVGCIQNNCCNQGDYRQEGYKMESCILRDCKPADGKKVLVCCTLELCSWAWVLRTEL